MNYYSEIKKELIDNEAYKKIKDYSKNRYELERYYNVGKLLVEAQGGEARAKYGDGLIREYAKRLVIELNRKYSERNLRNMRRYYLLFQDEKWNALRSKLTWTHYRELLKLKDDNEIMYYIKLAIDKNLSYRVLHERIKSSEYMRLDSSVKLKLIYDGEEKICDMIKHPIVIKNIYDNDIITERMLKNCILENVEEFLLELGEGFTFIKSEYKIKLGDRYNYIDMLLFNYIYNCFAVVELKVTELKKEHLGQIRLYMNYIDDNVRKSNHDRTIGILVCKYHDEYVIKYCYNDNIYETTYQLV